MNHCNTWIYTIDLDQEVFSVDNSAHFRLNHIPKNDAWVKALCFDNEFNRFVLPQLVPAASFATLSLDPPRLTNSTEYEFLQTRIVKPKSHHDLSPSLLSGPKLRWILFNIIQRQQELSATLLTWQAQDLSFRELVFFVLCLAAGSEHLTLVDHRRVYGVRLYEYMYKSIVTEDGISSHAEFISALGVGYHMDGLPMGSSPMETKYWFEGALICLIPRLDCPGILEEAVVDAIDYGRAHCAKRSFNAVLISIEHLVLVKSLPDGSVDHTKLMPLIPVPTHPFKDARERYGDQALDAFYYTKFSKNSQEVQEPDETDVEEPCQPLDQQNGKSGHHGPSKRKATIWTKARRRKVR